MIDPCRAESKLPGFAVELSNGWDGSLLILFPSFYFLYSIVSPIQEKKVLAKGQIVGATRCGWLLLRSFQSGNRRPRLDESPDENNSSGFPIWLLITGKFVFFRIHFQSQRKGLNSGRNVSPFLVFGARASLLCIGADRKRGMATHFYVISPSLSVLLRSAFRRNKRDNAFRFGTRKKNPIQSRFL